MEHSYGTYFTIRPVPPVGTSVTIISGMWQGRKGVYEGIKEGITGSLHYVAFQDGDVSPVAFADPACMQYETPILF